MPARAESARQEVNTHTQCCKLTIENSGRTCDRAVGVGDGDGTQMWGGRRKMMDRYIVQRVRLQGGGHCSSETYTGNNILLSTA